MAHDPKDPQPVNHAILTFQPTPSIPLLAITERLVGNLVGPERHGSFGRTFSHSPELSNFITYEILGVSLNDSQLSFRVYEKRLSNKFYLANATFLLLVSKRFNSLNA